MSIRMRRTLSYAVMLALLVVMPKAGFGQAPTEAEIRPLEGVPPQIEGPYRSGEDNEADEADSPVEVAGAFRLKGAVIRGEDLANALTTLMLNPQLRARLAAVPMGEGQVPVDLQDKAFDKYVSLQLLGDAWAQLDAGRLTDVAMQLAEGERILLRPHKAISAADALQLAAKTAVDLGDTATLERLGKIAQARNDQALAAMLASSAKLTSAARDDEKNQDEIIIDAEGTGPAQYALLHACCRDLKRAKLAGDGKTLQVLEHSIPHLPLITKEHKAQLMKAAKRPTPELDAKSAQLQKTLHLLAGVGRCQYGDCSGAETGGILSGGTGFNKLQAPGRGGENGGRYLATAQALEDLEAAHRLAPDERAAVMSALEKLRAASRECDTATGMGCFP